MRRSALPIVIVLSALAASTALSQIMPYQTPSMTSPAPNPAPKNYTDYYMKNLQRYHRPQANVRDYTIDKYYLHNQNLSPYLNLGRRSRGQTLNNYYRYVRPEMERRSQLNPMAAPGVPGLAHNAGPMPQPGPSPGNYPAGVPNRAPVNPFKPNIPNALSPSGGSYYNKIYKK